MIIFDTDIVSLFAKAEMLELLSKAFSKYQLCITSKIKEELEVSRYYGYSFPEKIFSNFKLIVPTEKEYLHYEKLGNKYQYLGKGENEAISIAKSRKLIFATNDKKAFETADSEGVTVINIFTILKFMYNNILTKEEIIDLVETFERVDNTKLVNINRIFD